MNKRSISMKVENKPNKIRKYGFLCYNEKFSREFEIERGSLFDRATKIVTTGIGDLEKELNLVERVMNNLPYGLKIMPENFPLALKYHVDGYFNGKDFASIEIYPDFLEAKILYVAYQHDPRLYYHSCLDDREGFTLRMGFKTKKNDQNTAIVIKSRRPNPRDNIPHVVYIKNSRKEFEEFLLNLNAELKKNGRV